MEDDPYPLDENGHGTHVASIVAEQTDNGYGLTGLAYGVRLMPVRVLDQAGDGDATTIARGLRFAADHGAKVINLSLNFDRSITADRIPALLAAIEYAHRKGSLVVAGAGNTGDGVVAQPGSARHVLAVGSTTEHGCLSSFSNYGSGSRPRRARAAATTRPIADDPGCVPGRAGRSIYQITTASPLLNRFVVAPHAGTSMATPHVSATAALVVASGVLGHDPTPAAIAARLTQTTRDLGAPGFDTRYGWGLLKAAVGDGAGPGRAGAGGGGRSAGTRTLDLRPLRASHTGRQRSGSASAIHAPAAAVRPRVRAFLYDADGEDRPGSRWTMSAP